MTVASSFLLCCSFFFFKQKTAYELRISDWSSDVCSSDLDAALSARGPVVVWRDRTADELRDIQIARFAQGTWTAPRHVHRDNWHMPACPVHGPAVAANGEQVWVAWYAEAGGAQSLRVASSCNAGDASADNGRAPGRGR